MPKRENLPSHFYTNTVNAIWVGDLLYRGTEQKKCLFYHFALEFLAEILNFCCSWSICKFLRTFFSKFSLWMFENVRI
jgi:hypothetical protein